MNWFQKQQNLGKLQSKKYDLEKKFTANKLLVILST